MNEQHARALMLLSGFEVTDVFETTNKYWQRNDVMGPWWLVMTQYGLIQIGWRKRVISMDWKNTAFRGVLRTDPNITMWDEGMHSWSYADAVKDLTHLRFELDRLKEKSSATA